MKRTLLIVIGLAAVIAVTAIIYFVLVAPQSEVAVLENVPTATLAAGPVSEIVGATSTVTSNQSATLNWKTSGLVAETYAEVGEVVQAGDVLAVLDPGSLSPIDILAEADLVAAQRALENLIESKTQSASALQAVESAQQALDDAHNPEVDRAAALQAIAEAEKAVDEADKKLKIITDPPSRSTLDQAQANLVLAEKKLNDIHDSIARIEKKLAKRDDQYKFFESRKLYRNILEGLELQRIQQQKSYENSQQRYIDLQSPPNPNDVAVAEANLLESQAQLSNAEREWQRIQDGTSPADIALLEAQLADAQREWERVKDGPTPEDISAAQARVTAAQAALENTRIVAPFSGVITEAISKPNDQVSPGTPAFRLDDLSHLWVDVGISEIDVNLVIPGQPVVLTFDAILAKEYQGQVVEVSPVGTTNFGIVDFYVRVELLNADEDVRPGMTAAVEILVNQIEEALLVPNRAVQVSRGLRTVYVLDQDGNLTLIEVHLGASSEKYSQVLSTDLNPGDLIVSNPSEL